MPNATPGPISWRCKTDCGARDRHVVERPCALSRRRDMHRIDDTATRSAATKLSPFHLFITELPKDELPKDKGGRERGIRDFWHSRICTTTAPRPRLWLPPATQPIW